MFFVIKTATKLWKNCVKLCRNVSICFEQVIRMLFALFSVLYFSDEKYMELGLRLNFLLPFGKNQVK